MSKPTYEYRLLFPAGQVDRHGHKIPAGLGDKVYICQHGAITGRAMREHNPAIRAQIKVVKVKVEIIEEVDA